MPQSHGAHRTLGFATEAQSAQSNQGFATEAQSAQSNLVVHRGQELATTECALVAAVTD